MITFGVIVDGPEQLPSDVSCTEPDNEVRTATTPDRKTSKSSHADVVEEIPRRSPAGCR